MLNTDDDKKVFYRPSLRINLKDGDLRTGPKDRRKVHTYVANDRRSGIADRRRSQNRNNNFNINLEYFADE
jgi:hypothetical protein